MMPSTIKKNKLYKNLSVYFTLHHSERKESVGKNNSFKTEEKHFCSVNNLLLQKC